MKIKQLETSVPNGGDDITRCSSGMIDVITATMTTHSAPSMTSTKPTISLPSIASTPQLVSPMENVDVLRLVVSFIGPKQYRFIAVISQSFHEAYVREFPNDTATFLNASTVAYTKICWEELKCPSARQQYQLSASAAFFGSLPAMQYLRSVDCDWNEWA